MTKPEPVLPADVITAPKSEDQVIWRYMDFTKFLSLLEESALFFTRASSFEDPFEGSFPATQDVMERIKDMLPPGALDGAIQVNFSPGLPDTWRVMRRWALISCWHANDHESAAMWKLYSKSDEAIAIRSTVGRLRNALGDPPPIPDGFHGGGIFHLGLVDYIDYQRERVPSGNLISPFFRKRKSFEHEKELRAVVLQYPISENSIDLQRVPEDAGRPFPVDLSILVENVFVAPQAQTWYAELVEKVTARYGLPGVVEQSAMDAQPLF